MISKININSFSYTDALNQPAFTARASKPVESISSTVFKKLSSVRENKLGTYLGTSQKGDNITIQETRFGKEADLYVSYANKKNSNKFAGFHLTTEDGKPSSISTIYGEKVPYYKVKTLERILDTLA